jgi:hypothetical protein
MSYVLTAWRQPAGVPLPTSLAEAQAQLDAVQAGPPGPRDPAFLALARALEARFPDNDDDAQTYDSGLAILEQSSDNDDPYYNFGVSTGIDHWSAAYAHAVVQANNLGLHLFDMQEGSVYLANGDVFALGEPDLCIRAVDAWLRRDFAAAWAEYRRLAPRRNPKALQGWGQLLSGGMAGPRHHALGAALMQLGGADADEDPEGYGVVLKRVPPALHAEQAAWLARLREAPDLAAVVDAEVGGQAARLAQIEAAIVVPEHRAKAAEMLKRLAFNGHAAAAYRLSLELTVGKAIRGTPADVDRWHRNAARWGHPRAQATLGTSLAQGPFEQLDEAERWLLRAKAAGEPDLELVIARLRLRRAAGPQGPGAGGSGGGGGEESLAARAGRGDAGAMYQLARRTLLAKPAPDPSGAMEAARMLERAANQGHLPAAAWLGECLAWGRYGLPKDPARGRQWLEQAVAGDDAIGLVSMAQWLMYGAVSKPQPALALECATRAAAKGDGNGWYLLAVCLLEGTGGPPDPVAAKAAFRIAQSLPSPLLDLNRDLIPDFAPNPQDAAAVDALHREMAADGRRLPAILDGRSAARRTASAPRAQPRPGPASRDAVGEDDEPREARRLHIGHAALVAGALGTALLLMVAPSVGKTGFRALVALVGLIGAFGVWRSSADLEWSTVKRAIVAALALLPGVGFIACIAVLLQVLRER